MKNTIKTTALIAVGVIGGAMFTSATLAEETVNPVITRVDDKTAVETRQVEVVLDINNLKEEIEFNQFNKTKWKTSCDAQIDIYNTKIDEVRAKIQSLKDLGIE